MARFAGCRIAVGLCVLLGTARASALPAPENDVPPPPASDPESSRMVPPPAPPPKGPISRIGVEAVLGGGVTGFLERNARSFLKVGGAWNLRVAVGTRLPFVLEASYVGSVQTIAGLGLDPDAVLVGNGAEGDLRFNPLQGWLQPYVLAGAGWVNYRIRNTVINNSDVNAADNVFVTPIGAGATARWGPGLLVDLRGIIRLTYDNALLSGAPQTTHLHSWGLGASLGWEF